MFLADTRHRLLSCSCEIFIVDPVLAIVAKEPQMFNSENHVVVTVTVKGHPSEDSETLTPPLGYPDVQLGSLLINRLVTPNMATDQTINSRNRRYITVNVLS